MTKTALITGISGQDGSYLARLLLNMGYKVYGTYRRTSTLSFWRLEALGIVSHPNLKLLELDITDLSNCVRLFENIRPTEAYNLAAQSFVGTSFVSPSATAQITGLGVLNVLEALRISSPESKFYQASSSEMFGRVSETPQSETTAFYPRSPYGVSKLFGHWITVNYRESYGLHCSSGILFNHESPLRGSEFVTRKITIAAAQASQSEGSELVLGNLSAIRDWGHAADYVDGMWRMLQSSSADDYVLATGRGTSVRDFTKSAYGEAGVDLEFEGIGLDEVGFDRRTGAVRVRVSEKFFRPAEVDLLLGDSSKARTQLEWSPAYSLGELTSEMVKADISRLTSGHGFK